MPQATSRIVLASQSPRRRRLLEWLALPFESDAVDTPESLDSPLAHDPVALAVSLAVEKAEAAQSAHLDSGALLMCFDTIVVHDGAVLGKPLDERDALRMLTSLSGRTHQVVTGVALVCPGDEAPKTFSVSTDVTMRELSEDDIAAWMAQGTYLGCAGAYNIEAQVAAVTDWECYQNVAGLPLCHLYRELLALPASCTPGVPASPVTACDRALCRHCELATELGTRA